MGDLTQEESTQYISLVDENTGLKAKIELIDGEPRVITGGVQSIESLKGFDPICDCWFYIGTELDDNGAGNIGDTVRVQIAAGSNPSKYPAIDITYTLIADDAGDEEQLALNIANYLNADVTFNQLWRAQRIQGNGCVYITAKKPGGQYERPNVDDFQVTSTGTTIVTRAQQEIVRQNKGTGLTRDPVDPRNGQLGTQASVIEVSGNLTSRFINTFDLSVDGSVTPVKFTIPADAQEVKYISSIAFDVTGNGIKFGQFASKSTLPNGIQINFKSNDIMITGEFLKTTDDLQAFHAEDPDNFGLYIQKGVDKLYVVRNFSPAIELRPQNEFSIDDYVDIVVNDNLISGISDIRAIVNGFNREF
jgi:hypothetical protein